MAGLECGHKFCTYCWGEYLTTKIMEEGLCQSISCAAHGCDIIVDDVTVMKLVPDSRVKLKYQHLITNSFVEVNILLTFQLRYPSNRNLSFIDNFSVIVYYVGVHRLIAHTQSK